MDHALFDQLAQPSSLLRSEADREALDEHIHMVAEAIAEDLASLYGVDYYSQDTHARAVATTSRRARWLVKYVANRAEQQAESEKIRYRWLLFRLVPRQQYLQMAHRLSSQRDIAALVALVLAFALLLTLAVTIDPSLRPDFPSLGSLSAPRVVRVPTP